LSNPGLNPWNNHLKSTKNYLTKEIDSFVDEESWHGDDNDDDDAKEEDL
jgi:hypothetical protein